MLLPARRYGDLLAAITEEMPSVRVSRGIPRSRVPRDFCAGARYCSSWNGRSEGSEGLGNLRFLLSWVHVVQQVSESGHSEQVMDSLHFLPPFYSSVAKSYDSVL